LTTGFVAFSAIVFANTNGVTPVDFTIEILRAGLAERSGS
jgi:hypothetical protein